MADTIARHRTSKGPIGVGTTTRWETRFLARSMTFSFVVSEFEPDRKITLESASAPFRIDTRMPFAPTADGTEITWIGEGDRELGGVSGRLAEPLVVAI